MTSVVIVGGWGKHSSLRQWRQVQMVEEMLGVLQRSASKVSTALKW
jgi:hypothetical protein